MCIIISMDRDHSTDEVIDWIHFYGGSFERINITRDIESKPLSISLNSNTFNSKHYKKGWLRKNGMFRDLDCYKQTLVNESFDLTQYIYQELNVLRKMYLQEDVKWIGNPANFNISKVEVLQKALKNKIDIPDSYIINTKAALVEVYDKFEGSLITKSLSDIPRFKKADKIFNPLTFKITKADIDQLPDVFFPTLVQRLIEKEFEIRSFYLEGEFYSAAIFSQNDPLTKLDFRKYNYRNPNRLIPYQIHKSLELQLDQLCKDCGINTGSIDIIKGTDGKFYFLEINQGGQFGMVSRPCNYKLEKLVATKLI